MVRANHNRNSKIPYEEKEGLKATDATKKYFKGCLVEILISKLLKKYQF
jgi:hypothetical protein